MLKKNLIYNFLLSASQVLFPLLTIPYISRVLQSEAIGKVNFTDSLAYFMVVVAEIGIPTLAIREIAKLQSNKTELQNRTNQLISFHIISTMFTSLLFGIAMYFLWMKVQSIYLILLALIYFVSNVFNCEWYYWGTEKFKYISLRTIITRIVGVIFIFYFIKQPSDFEKYYAIIIFSALANTILNALPLLKHFTFTTNRLKIDFTQSLPIYFIGVLYSVTSLLDNVLLGVTSSLVAVAYYANAIKIARMSGAIITDSFHVFFPRTSNLIAEENHEKLQEVFQKTIQLILIITIPLCVGLFVFAKSFCTIYFGENLFYVYKNLMILSIFPFIKSFSLFFSKQILLSYHKDKIVLHGYLIGSSVFVFFSFGLSYFFHDIGSSIALILAETCMLIYFYYYASKQCSFFIPEKFKAAVLFLSTFFIFLSCQYVFNKLVKQELFSFLSATLVATLLYISLLFAFKMELLQNIKLFKRK